MLSVGMPVYNEADQLARSMGLLVPALERLGVAFEVVLVDDGSRDATPRIVDALAARDRRIRAMHHPTNLGVGAGIATSIRAARGTYYILIPADLAMDLDQLGSYLAAAERADVVAGFTGDRPDYTPYRRAVSRINRTLLRLLFGLDLRNPNYIQLYRLSLVHQFNLELTGSAILYAELMVKCKRRGARIVQIPVRYVPRAGGTPTGAKMSLILRTGRDMARLWLRYVSGRLD